jgi:hypothetical protein
MSINIARARVDKPSTRLLRYRWRKEEDEGVKDHCTTANYRKPSRSINGLAGVENRKLLLIKTVQFWILEMSHAN